MELANVALILDQLFRSSPDFTEVIVSGSHYLSNGDRTVLVHHDMFDTLTTWLGCLIWRK